MGHFEELYPGRFLKGVTLMQPKTIRIVEVVGDVELEGDDGLIKSKAVLRYKDNDKHKDKPGEIVWVRTNAQLAAVALNEPDHTKWGGRLLTIHHDKTVQFGKEKKGGIRVLGAPDMKASVEVAIKMPRRKHPIIYQLHPTGKATSAKADPKPDPQAEYAEGTRLYTRLAELNQAAAGEIWAKAIPMASKIAELHAAVTAAEGGQA